MLLIFIFCYHYELFVLEPYKKQNKKQIMGLKQHAFENKKKMSYSS